MLFGLGLIKIVGYDIILIKYKNNQNIFYLLSKVIKWQI